MHPYVLEIFGFRLPTYGLLVATAFLCAMGMTNRLAKRAGMDPERVLNLAMYCAIAGIAGAKLLMILVDLGEYVRDPRQLFSLSTLQAAGIFYGGLVLALVVAYVYMRRQKMPLFATADVFAPGLALGHAIGRLGCFAAGCCWGTQCDRPWAVTFTSKDAHDLVGVPLNVPLHPSQLYESFAEFAICGYLYWRIHRKHAPGAIIGQYLVLYAVVRFLVDFVRTQQQTAIGPFTNAQWISLGLAAVAGVTWLRTRRTT